MPAPIITVDYAAELQTIKTELATLRNLIHSAVKQMKSAVESVNTNIPVPAREMEIDDDHSNDCSKATSPDLSALISELKHDIATLALKMREKLKQQPAQASPRFIPYEMTPFPT